MINEGAPTPTDQAPPALHAGMKIPPFVKGGPPATDSRVANRLVGAFNVALALKVVRQPAQPDSDGITTPTADVAVSGQNIVITLHD